MNYSDNYNFKLPEAATDNVNIEDLNENFEVIDSEYHSHVNNSSGNAHPVATTLINGFMSAEDKQKLNGASSAATASVIMKRDAFGRCQVTSPGSGPDIANKEYVDRRKYVVGSYTGSGEKDRHIELPFSPQCVIVFPASKYRYEGYYEAFKHSTGMALRGYNCLGRKVTDFESLEYITNFDPRYCTIGITGNGFKVSTFHNPANGEVWTATNDEYRMYYYIAFK